YGIYAIQMWSHKLLRWLVPFALIAAFVANVALWPQGLWFQALLVLQGALYLLALAGYLITPLQQYLIFRIPLYFIMVNLSILVAWIQYWRGEKYVVWTATER